MSKEENGKVKDEIANGVSQEEVKEKPKQKKKTEKELLLEEVEALKEENMLMADKMFRAVAELENFKKRTEKEREAEKKYNNIYLIEKLLFSLDQLNIVVNNNKIDDPAIKNYLIGFKMINDQIFATLKEDGLEQIKTDGEMFDPNVHNALEKEEDRTKAKGIILKTTQTGYKYKERLIRPAIVVVNEWSDEDGNNE